MDGFRLHYGDEHGGKDKEGPWILEVWCPVRIKFGIPFWISYLALCLIYIAENKQPG